MRSLTLTILLHLLLVFSARSQSLYFPPLTGSAWDTLSPASLGWCTDKIDTLYGYLENSNSKAFILLKDGKIVLEKYFGTFTQDSLWYWASAGKSLTAFMVGIAQQENYLSINDTTSDYLGQGWTNATPAQEEKITIRHQLTMTSGLDDGVPDHHCTLDTCLDYLADAGTRWAYHNGPYTLLDGVIQSATGSTLNSYVTQKVKLPTGITGSFFSSGYNNVFVSKPRSMARFGLLILNGGNWNGNQIMTDAAYFNQMVNTSQPLNQSYGYLWWLNGKPSFMVPGLQFAFPGPVNTNAPNDMFAAIGKNGQLINVVPSQNLVWIRMGNAPGGGDVPFFLNDSIWMKLNAVMCNASGTGENISNDNAVKVYPNPANDHAAVELQGEAFDLVLTDICGRVLYEEKSCFNRTVIDTKQLNNGIYLLRVSASGARVKLQKLVISR